MNVLQILLALVQMHVCMPISVPDKDAYALICPIPKDVHDAIVGATSDPA